MTTLHGIACALQVLDAVEHGIDLLDTAYATEMAAAGHALVFPLHHFVAQLHTLASPSDVRGGKHADEHVDAASPPQRPPFDVATDDAAATDRRQQSVSSQSVSQSISQNLTLDMADLAHGEDKAPLLCGCSCYTCSNYSRAYLHHLVLSEELLASVLLEMHNTHHMQSWFALLRADIADGGFGHYAAWFRANAREQSPVARKPLADAVPIAGTEDAVISSRRTGPSHARQRSETRGHR